MKSRKNTSKRGAGTGAFVETIAYSEDPHAKLGVEVPPVEMVRFFRDNNAEIKFELPNMPADEAQKGGSNHNTHKYNLYLK